ncbi:MAG TPA: hypothetical protein VFG23_09725 [Polyangia bacterium]|nr:hypothetical protein [Polyangia bacterium]
MSPGPSEGLRNDALRAALAGALAGKVAPLEDLLCRAGGHGTRPNLRLAAAFGAEMMSLPGTVAPLLRRLGENDAAPDTPQVFLPVAAAHGWVARLRADREVGSAWDALAGLAGDERMPVRIGTLDALTTFATRPGGADTLVERGGEWLEIEDREISFGASAVVVEVFANRQALAALSDSQPLLDYLSRAIAAVAAAPRAAERSDARRRLLLAFPKTLAAVVIAFGAGHRGATWLEEECRHAKHPDLRAALSNTILGLGDKASGQGAALAQQLRSALEGSAKPPRDPTRKRPGAARGKSSRPMR